MSYSTPPAAVAAAVEPPQTQEEEDAQVAAAIAASLDAEEPLPSPLPSGEPEDESEPEHPPAAPAAPTVQINIVVDQGAPPGETRQPGLHTLQNRSLTCWPSIIRYAYLCACLNNKRMCRCKHVHAATG